MKILTVIGARPQFIKAAAVSHAFSQSESITEVILHTGQHYDPNMSDIFFNQMGIPKPAYTLNHNGLSHGAMTGRMLEEIESIICSEKPDLLMVFGDTNSTLAGALAASKLNVPVAHIEAGLRSFNMKMPEEVNRILTDRISKWLFCPTQTAIENLDKEGYREFNTKIFLAGDVMQDAAVMYQPLARPPTGVNIKSNYVLATIHRAENTDDLNRLTEIVDAFNEIAKTRQVIVPIHPRTRNIIKKNALHINFDLIEPVGYLEMLYLLDNCQFVITDSGGLQKEAFFFEKACITTRDETEWVELIDSGVNRLVGANKKAIIDAVDWASDCDVKDDGSLYGGGKAAQFILHALLEQF
jgi:UDP-GlcNAc3NAcA epimerase